MMKRQYKYFFLALLLALVPGTVYSQKISEVLFEQDPAGFQFSEDLLMNQIQSRKGDNYSERVVNEDVKRLYAKGFFSDVVSIVNIQPDGSRQLIFKVSPKPVVEKVVFNGNRKYSDSVLRKFVRLTLDNPLNDAELKESLDRLRNFYHEQGLKNSKINFEIQNVSPNQIQVVFQIDESLRVRIHDVFAEGATVFDLSEIQDAIATRYALLSASWLSWLPLEQEAGLLDKTVLEQDKTRLRELYWRKGYLDFTVKDILVSAYDGDPEWADVTFVVEEGEPYFVGDIKITGAVECTEDELRKMLSLKSGDVYNVQLEQRDLEMIESIYAPMGYDEFYINVVRNPNYETHTVDLEYILNEGRPYTIGRIYVTGNKYTKYKVIVRETLLQEGDPVDREKIEISKQRLLGMGYFGGPEAARRRRQGNEPVNNVEGVEIVTFNSPEPGKKDVYINVQERPFISGRVGAAVSDSDGVAGMLEIQHSNVDLFDPENYFTGGGQRARISALAGTETMDLQFDFTEPWLFDMPLRFDTSVFYHEVMYDDWDESRLGFTVSLMKNILDDYTTITGGYTFEQVRVMDMARKLSSKFQSQKGRELVGRVFAEIERDTLDNPYDPRNGYDVSLYGALNSQAFGGTVDYYKLELKGVNYYSFFHDWFVLMTAFKIGSVNTFNGDEVPLFDRYFLGGGDSIRGFPYRSIGPADGNEDNYGGQFMWLGTVELSHPIYSIFRGAFFTDIGNATSGSFGPFGSPNMGIGYGLRINVPGIVLPIRLDLAYPIVCHQEGVKKRLRFHFSAGFSI